MTATPTDISFLSSLVLMKDGTEIAQVTEHTPAAAMNNANVRVDGNLDSNASEKGSDIIIS